MKFYGELLVIFILLITNGRILFLRNAKKDSVVILAPLGFLLSILQIFNWGLDLITGSTLVLSILVLLTNFHALFRYSERLYVDHYSILMKIWSAITIFISIVLLAATIYFAPVEYKNTDLKITEKVTRYEGSFRTDFEKISHLKKTNAFVSEFAPETVDSQSKKPAKNVILFIPDKRADTYYYKTYLQQLAYEGFTVVSADFYSDDCKWCHSVGDLKIVRRLAMVIDYFKDTQKFLSQKEFYTYNIMQELKAMEKIIAQEYGENCSIFIVTDVMGEQAVSDFYQSNTDKVTGTFNLSSIEEYKTAGFGIACQSDIFLANLLGQERDKDGFYTKYMVLQTKKAMLKAGSQK